MTNIALRRSLTCALAGLALSGGAVIGLAPAASAGVCGETFNPTSDDGGARAYWQISCQGGNVTMSGWVEDIAKDGRCGKVKAVFSDGTTVFSNGACPKGDRENFSWTRSGSSVRGEIFTYKVD